MCFVGLPKHGVAVIVGYFFSNFPYSSSTIKATGVGVSIDFAEAALIEIDVTVSTKHFRLRSTEIPNFAKKSAPKIGLFTCATRNSCLKVRCKPRSNSSNLLPKV